MDSFELNKILGAVLGTCLVLLVTSFAAHAIFAPVKPEKPGFEIAVKEDASAAAAPRKPQLRPSRSRSCCRPPRSRRAPAPPRSAPPATPSKRAAPTASVRTSTASSTRRRAQGRGGFNFSAALKGKGGTWTYDDLNKFLANPKAFVPGTAMGFAGIPKDSERADVIAYLRSLVGQARLRCRPRRSNISSVLHGLRRHDGQALPGRLLMWLAVLLSGRFAARRRFLGWYHEEKAT